jgi:phospholipid/cholesterol/gamma-HCH transport system substrate-binding protein
MNESRLEAKVGLFVVLGLLGLGALLFFMGEFSFSKGTSLTVNFSHTGNVTARAPVKVGGIQVGSVERIELLPERKDELGESLPVKMTLSIQKNIAEALAKDTHVTVSSQGPLGESYLELSMGTATQKLEGLQLRGTDAPRIDVVTNRLARFLELASKGLDDDPEAVSKLFRGIGGLTGTMDGMLSENRDDLKTLTHELMLIAKDLRTVAALSKAQLEPGGKAIALIDDAASTAKWAKKELPEIALSAKDTLGDVRKVTSQLSEEDGRNLKTTLIKYKEAGEKINALAERGDRLLHKLENGDGTMGALIKDKQAYDDLKSLLSDLRKNPWKMLWKD